MTLQLRLLLSYVSLGVHLSFSATRYTRSLFHSLNPTSVFSFLFRHSLCRLLWIRANVSLCVCIFCQLRYIFFSSSLCLCVNFLCLFIFALFNSISYLLLFAFFPLQLLLVWKNRGKKRHDMLKCKRCGILAKDKQWLCGGIKGVMVTLWL